MPARTLSANQKLLVPPTWLACNAYITHWRHHKTSRNDTLSESCSRKNRTPGGTAVNNLPPSQSEIWLRNHSKGSGFSLYDNVLPGFQLRNCYLPLRNYNYTIVLLYNLKCSFCSLRCLLPRWLSNRTRIFTLGNCRDLNIMNLALNCWFS